MASSIKALSGKEKGEMVGIGNLLSSSQQKTLIGKLKKIKGLGGQTAVNKAVRNFLKGTGGLEVQKKAKAGGNPDIQKKQGFIGAKKANGGSVMKKKKKMMAKGGAAGGMKKPTKMMGGGKAKKMMKGGGKTKKYMARGGKAR